MENKEGKNAITGNYSFLESVAEACLQHYGDLSDICFVFPNKRSGSFFLKNLSSKLGSRSMLAPEVLDIGSFMNRISGLETAPRIDLLFRLYIVYKNICNGSDSLSTKESLLDFERFAPWGEIVLGDFSEVDKFDVDAAQLFENVRNYRNLSSNFLTEEQYDTIERYFGYRPSSKDVEQFWKSVYDVEDLSSLKEKFIELWRLLPELYEGLLENLESDGLAMEGTTFLRALQRVEEKGRQALEWKNIVVVGFNMLSTTEAKLFARLRDIQSDEGEPYASFFWDATGPVLKGTASSNNIAAKTMRLYIKNFPMPDWGEKYINLSERSDMPSKIDISAAPSNVAQVKIAGEIVKGWHETEAGEINDAKAAVIVPDENLLLPLIYSLPEDLKSVNLTMGFSMRYTAVASFIYHLRRLQSRIRTINGEAGYYHEDVRLFMSHPLVHAVIGSNEANKINGEIDRLHLRTVTVGWLIEQNADLGSMLRPVSHETSVEEIIVYIDNVLEKIDDALKRGTDGLRTVNSKIERSQIVTYRMALSRLHYSLTRHNINIGYIGVFHLVDRLIAGEKIMFEGEPLSGLQVMGLLETRALDFERIIILSMNDKIMPRRSRRRTFVPDSLRRGFGLPTSSQPEELYSYYFYRLISRAKEVELIYDAREGEGMRSGGKSRYLMQLEMLYARNKVNEKNYTFRLNTVRGEAKPIQKTPEIMEKIEAFRKIGEEGRNLSASALMDYCACQVKFYFKDVAEIKDDKSQGNYIDSATQGNIVHEAMQHLYFPKTKRGRYLEPGERIVLTRADLESKLKAREETDLAVRHAVNKYHFGQKEGTTGYEKELEGGVAMVAKQLVERIENVMRYDMSIAPFELIGGEMSQNVRWRPTPDSPEVNMRYAFDRVDFVNGRWRVVDYKTGSSHVKAGGVDDIFSGAYDAKYMIQVMLYSHLLESWLMDERGINPGDIEMLIYDINEILKKGAIVPEIDKTPVSGHKEQSAVFLEGLGKLINDIFDESKPFLPDETEKACAYCSFQTLCGKS